MMRKYMNLLIILFIALLGGAAGVFFKIAIEEIPPDLFTFLRFVVAYLAFIPFFIREKTAPLKERGKLIPLSLLGTANVMFFIFGLQYTTSTISGMMYAAGPLIVAILSLFIIKEKISFSKWFGVILG